MDGNGFCNAARHPATRLALLAAGLLLPLAAGHALDGISPPAPMAGFAFMQGCWSGDADAQGTRIDEYYSAPVANLLLGQVRRTRNGQVAFFEFLRIEATDDGVWLEPLPMGRPVAIRFQLVSLQDDRAVFENTLHDFPQRIEYRLLPDKRLLTRVAGEAGGETRVEEYQTRQTSCR